MVARTATSWRAAWLAEGREVHARAKRELPDRVRAFAETYQQIVLEVVRASAESRGADGR